MSARPIDTVSALTFDVFGTILDLTGSLVPPLKQLLSSKDASVDADVFWDRWRGGARQRVEQFQDTLLMLGHSIIWLPGDLPPRADLLPAGRGDRVHIRRGR